MASTAVFTSANLAYLDRVRVLFETVGECHPEWDRWLCFPDELPTGVQLDWKNEPYEHVLKMDELGIPGLPAWIFAHDVVELCTAVKGPALRYLLGRGYDRVVYLDPDIALFSPLSELEELLNRSSVVLTPHLLQPENDSIGVLENEIGALKHGVYNLGFVGVSNTSEGCLFAEWWCDRLLAHCYDDIPAGLFTDQRWCDHVPVFFPQAAILRHQGYNVASWNLHKRPISIDGTGTAWAGADPLRFFHFTKLTTIGEEIIARSSDGLTDVLEIVGWYKRQIREKKVTGLPPRWWHFGIFANGVPITRKDRQLVRKRLAGGGLAGDPFHSRKRLKELL